MAAKGPVPPDGRVCAEPWEVAEAGLSQWLRALGCPGRHPPSARSWEDRAGGVGAVLVHREMASPTVWGLWLKSRAQQTLQLWVEPLPASSGPLLEPAARALLGWQLRRSGLCPSAQGLLLPGSLLPYNKMEIMIVPSSQDCQKD